MKKELKEKNEELIRECQEKIKEVGLGTKESEQLIDDMTKLAKFSLEDEKFERENRERFEKTQKEDAYRFEQIKRDKRESLIKNILAGVGTLTSLGMGIGYFIFAHKGFKLEETGSYTSKTLTNRVLPKFDRR